MRENLCLNQGSVTVEVHTQLGNDLNKKKPPLNTRNFHNKRNKQNCWKSNTFFRCGLEYHFIAKFLKPDTLDKKVYWNVQINENR